MSYARHRRESFLALAAAVALGLSACSSGTPAGKAPSAKAAPSSSSSTTSATSTTSAATTGNSAPELLEQLRKSSAAAKSVRVKGTINNSSTTKAVKLQINIAGDRAGKNMRAIVNDGTGEIEILTTGGQTYLKADTAYWTKNGSAAIAKLAAGKYIKIPPESAAGIGGLTVGTLLDQILAKDMSTATKLNTKVAKTTVNGVPAYAMTTKTDNTKIYVSADGQARLLRVEAAKDQGTVDFAEWNAVAPVSAPPADQQVEIPRS